LAKVYFNFFFKIRVQDPQSSELVSYLQKLLNAGIGKENANVRGNSNNNLETNPDASQKNGNIRPISSEIPRLKFTFISLKTKVLQSAFA